MINNLLSPIIETILRLLPFKEAVRISILCKDWKYHWTNVPKLEFVANVVKVSNNDNELHKERLSQANRKVFHAINHVMSIHQGPIHEFSLSTYAAQGPCVEIVHIIDNLSRNNAIKKLTLDMPRYWLPESLPSLHKLTDLYLNRCRLDNPNPGSLLDIDDHDSTVIIKLFECLPVIKNLTIHLLTLKYFAQGRTPNKLPAALVHLKYLCITDTCIAYEHKIPCYALLIRSSPNLEKLKLVVNNINLSCVYLQINA
ncbi:putative leucine-rich repeat domain superfamily, F-box-like domain superfamily [Helianthus anomalus]